MFVGMYYLSYFTSFLKTNLMLVSVSTLYILLYIRYAVLPGTIPPRNGTALCARLVRRLMQDETELFLDNPLTWDEH